MLSLPPPPPTHTPSPSYRAVERQGSSEAASPARLLVGSLHDDALLVCRSLALDTFPSPLVLRTRTRGAVKEKGAAVQVGSSSSSQQPAACCAPVTAPAYCGTFCVVL